MLSLLSTAYLPPVSYLLHCKNSDELILEQHEHFIKQTYRNRCCIYGPNGKQSLVIPVKHNNLSKIPIREVRISYDVSWNKVHWKSICSAYRNSPYFEYYEEEFQRVFEKSHTFLFDFNLTLLELIFDFFKIKKTILFTEAYEILPAPFEDLRNKFHPKREILQVEPYHQVFLEKHGFINDLSCIDLLFNAR